VKLLLDTHAALWMLTGDLSEKAKAKAFDPASTVLLSSVVVWEIAIKTSLGRLDAPRRVHEELIEAGAIALPITHEHANAVGDLPWHHRDPFDRLLIAQAQVEKAAIVTTDPHIAAYGISTLW
jgi:PIN domain nuclease of toxin-antitoxin system